MGRLIYAMNVSLDGFVETPDHGLDWAVVDDEVHDWFNELARSVDASIYGRRMYELMTDYWPNAASDPQATRSMLEFALIWRDTPKFVFTSTLDEVGWNTRLLRGHIEEGLASIRREFSGDIDVGGATLAAEFIRRGLIDEYRLVVHPVVIGAGTPYFPRLDRPLPLRLADTHQFSSGVTWLAYVPLGR